MGRSRGPQGLRDGPEFDLIRDFTAGLQAGSARVEVGPGDDAAVLKAGGIVLSTDLTVEEVHFRRGWLSPEAIGYRSVMVAMSDLAAMAAQPVGALLSCAFPANDTGDFARRVMAGARAALEVLDAELLGGDLAASPGPIVIDVTAVGATTHPVLRNGARPGDGVWVTGELGGSAAAVRAWLDDREPAEMAAERFRSPVARIREARWLVDHLELTAMIDLSDGLGGDVAHIARASGVAVDLDAESIPVFGADQPGVDVLERALNGGEDYELAFTCAKGDLDPALVARFREEMGIALTRVGEVRQGAGVWLRRNGEAAPLRSGGYQHFGKQR